MDQVFFNLFCFSSSSDAEVLFMLVGDATRNDRNMWRAKSYFLRGNNFFLLLIMSLRNSSFCLFFILSQAFESFECSSLSYSNKDRLFWLSPENTSWLHLLTSSCVIATTIIWHFFAPPPSHTQKKTFARIQFTQETNSTSKSYSFNKHHCLRWTSFELVLLYQTLRAIDYTREKDCNRMTLLEFLRLIFKIIKIRFRIFFYLRFDSPKRKNLKYNGLEWQKIIPTKKIRTGPIPINCSRKI